LIHHEIKFQSPAVTGNASWVITTSTGTQRMTTANAEAFCAGLATKERALTARIAELEAALDDMKLRIDPEGETTDEEV
jgi:hypothetical protein